MAFSTKEAAVYVSIIDTDIRKLYHSGKIILVCIDINW